MPELQKRIFKIVGFDDISFSKLLSPELTTIIQPIKEMAEKAAAAGKDADDHNDGQQKGYEFLHCVFLLSFCDIIVSSYQSNKTAQFSQSRKSTPKNYILAQQKDRHQ